MALGGLLDDRCELYVNRDLDLFADDEAASLERGIPVRLAPSVRGMSGGHVRAAAGPWRTSGFWWSSDGAAWLREEWDIELADGALYRLVRDRARGMWELEGVID